ncbi:F0F1 ATP synthase subunit B [Candidatus Falkowbacteria bacterium]|jgi:F-type H+-transporting ATPase subunit b|nr:F0F1 ATP synthase subunit B [Candidatus Falkowbacteria bacterium]MBT5503487.1 F0F1 ATP synthase subunit B [Candidatus Falkowbacteria bacterium]MBT7348222.1 F0F1 ATP synthase subunit B [Candidatus Falkowbacteria bacterium]MBT7500201.1 F0F1 ATP synthase subunit B [Candidatus Falkowbacteria bacterium]
MDDLIKTFHIDWRLLIAQSVNFVIVIVVLGVFALKPLVKLMKEREEKIKKGITDAEKIEGKMLEIEEEREVEVKKGRKEAQGIISKSEKQGEEVRAEKVTKAQKEVEKIITDARSQIGAERTLMLKDVKDELGGLIALALDKIASGSIDEKKHKKLIEQTIADLKNADLK